MWKCWVSGHWEKSEQSGYIHLLYCSSDERLKAEVCLQDWSTSSALGGLWLVEDLIWCAEASPTPPCWPPSIFMTAPPLCILQFHLCLSKLSLHLRMRVSLNVSTSWLSRPGIYCSSRIHTCFHSLVSKLFIQEVRSFKGYVIWGRDFPQTLPHLLSDSVRSASWEFKSKEIHLSDPVSYVDNSR